MGINMGGNNMGASIGQKMITKSGASFPATPPANRVQEIFNITGSSSQAGAEVNNAYNLSPGWYEIELAGCGGAGGGGGSNDGGDGSDGGLLKHKFLVPFNTTINVYIGTPGSGAAAVLVGIGGKPGKSKNVMQELDSNFTIADNNTASLRTGTYRTFTKRTLITDALQLHNVNFPSLDYFGGGFIASTGIPSTVGRGIITGATYFPAILAMDTTLTDKEINASGSGGNTVLSIPVSKTYFIAGGGSGGGSGNAAYRHTFPAGTNIIGNMYDNSHMFDSSGIFTTIGGGGLGGKGGKATPINTAGETGGAGWAKMWRLG